MRWLTRSRSDQAGSVLILVVLLTVTLVAMAAMVVDVGALLDERRQLQNGADAGSLAVAHSCAAGPCDANLAEGLADGNSRDGDSAVDSVTYPAANRVKVTTSTRGGGRNILPYSFGQAVTGEKGRTVRASATAAWGPVGSAVAIPLAISKCDLQQLAIGTYGVITFKKGSGPCSGKDAPGAFGWLDGACPTTFTAGTLVNGNPGASGPKDCLHGLMNTDILLPVFDTVTGSGNSTKYHLVGFAALRLTGWRFPGDQSSPRPCSPPETCIAGTFVKFVTSSAVGGGADFGVNTVFLVS